MLKTILVMILSYLIGSIPWALVIGKLFYQKDIREYGSGNLGASNTNLAASGAMVYIYSGNSAVPMEVFSVPAGNGTVWNVFSYNAATSRLTIHNTLGTYLPS